MDSDVRDLLRQLRRTLKRVERQSKLQKRGRMALSAILYRLEAIWPDEFARICSSTLVGSNVMLNEAIKWDKTNRLTLERAVRRVIKSPNRMLQPVNSIREVSVHPSPDLTKSKSQFGEYFFHFMSSGNTALHSDPYLTRSSYWKVWHKLKSLPTVSQRFLIISELYHTTEQLTITDILTETPGEYEVKKYRFHSCSFQYIASHFLSHTRRMQLGLNINNNCNEVVSICVYVLCIEIRLYLYPTMTKQRSLSKKNKEIN